MMSSTAQSDTVRVRAPCTKFSLLQMEYFKYDLIRNVHHVCTQSYFIYEWEMLMQVGERRNKLSTLVRFPMTALDMAPHVVKRTHSMKNLSSGAWPLSWKQPSGKHQQPADLILPQDYLYDLYAVCNHHGGMHGGHYTGKVLADSLRVPLQWFLLSSLVMFISVQYI